MTSPFSMFPGQTQIPSAEFNYFGYASSGEAFSHGLRKRKDLPRLRRGDKVGFRLLFELQRVVFYLNDKPVVELVDMPAYEQFYPCVTFGNAGLASAMPPCKCFILVAPYTELHVCDRLRSSNQPDTQDPARGSTVGGRLLRTSTIRT